jgi:long-chain-fatty-acid--CoA ligase ACSBG
MSSFKQDPQLNVELKNIGTKKSLVERFNEMKDCMLPALITYDNKFQQKKVYSWNLYVRNAHNFAHFLMSAIPWQDHLAEQDNLTEQEQDQEQYKNVAIHSFNCPEWFIAAMGAMCSGRYFCGIYNTNKYDQCTHIIKTGKCGVLIVESYTLLMQSYNRSDIIDTLVDLSITIIVIDPSDRSSHSIPERLNGLTKDWDSYGFTRQTQNEFKSLEIGTNHDHLLATLIFTSGTTGNPKAVRITHKNIATTIEGVMERLRMDQYTERIVTYLPLSHIAGQAMDIYCPIYCGAQVHFAHPDALKGTLKNTLNVVRPTIFFGVPRVWEKFREGLMQVAAKKYTGVSGKVLGVLMGTVKTVECKYNTTNDYSQYLLYPFAAITSRIVAKIKKQLGLDRCKYFASGAAPISKEVLEYFASLGMPILEMYGMSETCGVMTVSDPSHSVRGSCGSPIRGVDIKIGDNNEILVKGDNIFDGYHHDNANDMKTNHSGVDASGYLHTGDCGKIDANGYLYITGRLKELIITAGGENIPPVLIEDNIKSVLKHDVQCILIGDRKKYLTMIFFNPNNVLTSEQVESAIKEYNTKLAISNAQKVQKFIIIQDSLTIENELLTPTMKLKRSKIIEKYSNDIEAMYGDD